MNYIFSQIGAEEKIKIKVLECNFIFIPLFQKFGVSGFVNQLIKKIMALFMKGILIKCLW